MLTIDRNAFCDPRPVRFDLDDPSPVFDVYLREVTEAMTEPKFEALARDLSAYDRTGVVTDLMEDVLRRAQCLADADRITTIFDGPDLVLPRRAA